MEAWNGWYHCTGSTYGTWLPGDSRGWRARHHRQHVNGDYKNPPNALAHHLRFTQSNTLMKRPRIILTPAQRRLACNQMAATLLELNVQVIVLCVGAKHWHLLARFGTAKNRQWQGRSARQLIGKAKGRSARALSRSGLTSPGGIWATRSRCMPVKNRAHQIRITHYILNHAHKGAATWSSLPPAKPRASALSLLPQQ